MKLKTVLVIAVVAFSLTKCASPTRSNPDTQKMVDEFFQTYKSTGHKEAVVALLSKNKWVTNEDAIKVSLQIDEIVNVVGKYYGSEKIAENTYGTSVIQYIYIAKYERQPLKFIFRFYQPNDKWELQSFNYEMDFVKELDETGKAYRLKENANH